MSIGFGIPYRIDGPPPEAPYYGLLAAAKAPAAGVRIVPDADERGIERWMNGVEVFPYPPDTGDIFDPCATGSDATTKGFGDTLEHPQFGAMTAFLSETCTTSHVWDQDEYKARATAALGAIESSVIAREFMTGDRMPAQPHLADGNGSFPIGDAVTNVPNGLALLEQQIALTGRMGLIHCSPQVVTTFRERFAVDNKTGVIRTINGIVVIPDFGYANGSTPTGHADPASVTQEWIYATGPVDIRQTEMFVMPERVEQAVDRGSGGATNGKPNSITYRAERYFLVIWDTELQAAVLIDRCQSDCGSLS